MVKRNEITYRYHARIDDLIDVYTSISFIKNSSFCFEHLLVNPETNKIFCYNKLIHVNLNPDTNIPKRIDDKYRKLFMDFEGKDLEVIKE